MGAIAIAFSSMVPRPAEADLVDPTDFTETEWLDTESDITGMAFAPDGSNRLFLTRKGGEVRIVQINAGGCPAALRASALFGHRPTRPGARKRRGLAAIMRQ